MFGKRLKRLRDSAGISQQKLADTIGLTQQAIAKWESSKAEPDLATVAKLAEYFDTTTDYLLGKSDSPAEPDLAKNAPLAFSGDTSDLDIEALRKIIKETVVEAMDEREKGNQTNN